MPHSSPVFGNYSVFAGSASLVTLGDDIHGHIYAFLFIQLMASSASILFIHQGRTGLSKHMRMHITTASDEVGSSCLAQGAGWGGGG